jgi:hypothetical protein
LSRGQGDGDADLVFAGRDRRRGVGRHLGHAHPRHHRLRRRDPRALFVDPEDAADRHPGAGRRGVGARPGVGHRTPQRLALDLRAVLQVEPNAADVGGARRDRDVDDLTDPRDVVEPHLDAVARDVAAQRLPAVLVVELRLQVVGARADRVVGQPDALSCCMTADMACALSFCASRGLTARDSAEIVTHARSGTVLTTPSPVVTTTGTWHLAEAPGRRGHRRDEQH